MEAAGFEGEATRFFWAGVVTAFALGLVAGALLFYAPEGPVFSQALQVQGSAPQTAAVNIVAVDAARGRGALYTATVEIVPGTGRTLFATNPFSEPDTQFSLETAKEVAQRFTRTSLKNADTIYAIQAEGVQLVGGPSAGAALALATVAAIQGKKVRPDAAVTGTIQPDGSIGAVGGVLEKAQAAAEHGVKVFLVPRGQGVETVYTPVTEQRRGPGFVFRRTFYRATAIDLNLLFSEEYGMEVVEVADLAEAAALAIPG